MVPKRGSSLIWRRCLRSIRHSPGPRTEPTRTETRYSSRLHDEVTLARPWAVPGTAGLEHRIGGLEKEDRTGNVSYDPVNHERMIRLRAAKIAGISADIPPVWLDDPDGRGGLHCSPRLGIYLRSDPGPMQGQGKGVERRGRPPHSPEPVPRRSR